MRFIKNSTGPKIFTNAARNAFSNKQSDIFNEQISRQIVRVNFFLEDFKITSVFRNNANCNLIIRDIETDLTYSITSGDIYGVLEVVNNALINHCSATALFKTMSGNTLKLIEEEN